MMPLLLFIFASVFIISCQQPAVPPITGALSSIGCIYLLVLELDGLRTMRMLGKLTGSDRRSASHRPPLTTRGSLLWNVATILKRRSLGDAESCMSVPGIVRARHGISIPSKCLSDEVGQNDTEITARILESVTDRFSPDGVAMLTQNKNRLSIRSRISCGIGGQRFERELREIYDTFLQYGETERLGCQDGLHGRRFLGDLAAFGFRYSVAAPFCINGERGILWLGYSAHRIPGRSLVQEVSEASSRLAREFEDALKVRELSGRVLEAELKDKEKREFIAYASHDMRSPLGNMRTILSILRLEGPSADSNELLDVAISNCDNLNEIVQDILDYSRHQMGQLVPCVERIELTSLVASVVQANQVSAQHRGLSIICETGGEPLHVLGDRRHLKRIFSNVIGNALKYTDQGHVALRIDRSGNGVVQLVVQDTGKGIPQKSLEKLFTPFSRFHPEVGEGVGLGLALSKVLLDLNSGSISISSSEGKGTEVRISLMDGDCQAGAEALVA